MEPIRKAGFSVVVDCMWGNGAGRFPRLLGEGATTFHEVHNERNPIYPHMSRPEPIPPNVDYGLSFVTKLGADVAIINDGDADRVGLVTKTAISLINYACLACLVTISWRCGGFVARL